MAFAWAVSTANAQAFDPASPHVLQAYAPPATGLKIDSARAGLNRLLPELARFPELLPTPVGSHGRYLIVGGDLDAGFNICACSFATVYRPFNHYTAGSDSDLAVLGDPIILNDAVLRATGSFTTARDFIIGPQPAVIDTNSFDVGISGNVSAAAQLEKSGAGTLTLTGSNVWSVAPVVTEGTLKGPAASLQTSIYSNGTVEFTQTSDGTYGHVLSGGGDLRKSGMATLVITGDNQYSGLTEILAGRIALLGTGRLGSGNPFGGQGSVHIAAGATLDLAAVAGDRAIGTLTGAGDIALGTAELSTVSLSDSVFAGIISGPGMFGKSGSGRLTLTAASTYTGGTTLAGGTLALAGAGRLNANAAFRMNAGSTFDISAADGERSVGSIEGGGTIVLGSNALTVGTDNRDTAFGGALQGSGGFTKRGSGALALDGVTQHTGITTIAEGTLIARAHALGPIIVNNSRLVFAETRTDPTSGSVPLPAGTLYADYPELYSYTGNISGTGRLIKQGSGALWLRGENSYTGGTLVEDGILVGNDRSLQGAIANNAGLAFYQAADGTYSGTVSGTGILLKYGPGNLTLTGINTHTGGTGFSGLLTIADDRNLGAAGASVILSGGTLRTNTNVNSARNFGLGIDGGAFDTAGNELAIVGVISGPGTLDKAGAGTLRLTGLNTYTGATRVLAGTLDMRGSLSSPVTVAAGAALAGSGSITSALTLAPGSTLRVGVDAQGGTDRISVSGTAQVQDAVLDVRAQTGEYRPRTRYTVLSAAAGVAGRFGMIAADFAFADPSLDYDAQNVYLTLVRNDVSYPSIAHTPGQIGVATALANLVGLADPDAKAVISALDTLAPEAARAAFDSVGGAGRASIITVQQSGQRAMTQQTIARLGVAEGGRSGGTDFALNDVKLAFDERVASDARPVYAAALANVGIGSNEPASRHGFWLRGYGGNGRADGSAGAGGASFAFSGIIAGYDSAVSDRLRLGMLASYSKPKLAQSAPLGTADVETRQLGAYGRYRDGPLRVDALASYALSSTDATRAVTIGGLTRLAASSYDGTTTAFHLESGYTLGGQLALEPYVSLQWSRQRDDGYAETGAGALNLTVAGRTLDSVRIAIGVKAAQSFALAGMQGTLQGSVSWAHEFRGQGSLGARLAGDTSGTSFSTPTTDLPRDTAVLTLGISIASSRALDLYADLSAEAGTGQRVHALGLGLRYRW